jgi:4-hydroxy-3-methylbut-2-enyl diphosphate reductase
MATEIRQDEANNLSKNADTCIVIGGKNSSNTIKLFNIAKDNCSNVIYIENENELDTSMIKGENVLILAGASTPEESIENTKNKIEK